MATLELGIGSEVKLQNTSRGGDHGRIKDIKDGIAFVTCRVGTTKMVGGERVWIPRQFCFKMKNVKKEQFSNGREYFLVKTAKKCSF